MTMMNQELLSAKQQHVLSSPTSSAAAGSSITSNNNIGCDGALIDPGELDILVGKESRARNHKGSRCFRLFVESYRRRYQDAKNKHKRASITREMYETITQASIRFLKYNDERKGWEEISSTEARDKITHALRFAQKKRRKHSSSGKSTPTRQNSDSTHRSETSTTSATSLDWDVLLLQQQQHLTGLSLSGMNASLRACRAARRSSLSSVGSASYLSRGDDSLSKDSGSRRPGHNSNHNSSNNNSSSTTYPHKARVSFSVTESTIYSADLSASVTSASLGSIESSVPLPVDLSSTQHFDMHASQVSLGAEVDRPPRMPCRPTEQEDEHDINSSNHNNNHNNKMTHQEDEEEEDWDDDDDDVLKRAGIDTLMNSSASGFCDLLDPLMEMDHERGPDSSSDNSSGSHKESLLLDEDTDDGDQKMPALIGSANNNNTMAQIDAKMANLCLQQHPYPQMHDPSIVARHDMNATSTTFATPVAHYGGNVAATIDTAQVYPCLGAAEDDPFKPIVAAGPSTPGNNTNDPETLPDQPTSDYSLQLMQEPLLEWWKHEEI